MLRSGLVHRQPVSDAELVFAGSGTDVPGGQCSDSLGVRFTIEQPGYEQEQVIHNRYFDTALRGKPSPVGLRANEWARCDRKCEPANKRPNQAANQRDYDYCNA